VSASTVVLQINRADQASSSKGASLVVLGGNLCADFLEIERVVEAWAYLAEQYSEWKGMHLRKLAKE
jgi:hypothetical protein